MTKNKKFNTTVTALWGTKTGNQMSMKIDAKAFDQIRAALEEVEIGGRLMVKKVSEETRQKFRNPDNAPEYFLEYMSKQQVEEWEAKNPRNRNREDEGGL